MIIIVGYVVVSVLMLFIGGVLVARDDSAEMFAVGVALAVGFFVWPVMLVLAAGLLVGSRK